MSQENVELVVRAMSAVFKRPKPDFETVNALYHPDHVFVSLTGNKLGEPEAKGGRGYKTWLGTTAQVMPWEAELYSAVDVGPDIVLAVATNRFRGATSGIETELRTWSVVTVSGGKITRTAVFDDPAEALEAVRLRE